MDDVPVELAHRLRPWEEVLWWGRPRRAPIRGLTDRALLPVAAIVTAALAAIVLVPDGWQTPVTVIFRSAITFSAISLSATHLTIVVRQRRHTCYGITKERALIVSGFWARGVQAWPLAQLGDISAQDHATGDGTIWFGVEGPAEPQFAHIAHARQVLDTLLRAQQAALLRSSLAGGAR
jgi:hypothetical protein